MSADAAQLEKLLVEWVERWIEGESGVVIGPSTNLSHTGLLDSMAIVGLISYLEEEADAEFDFATFDPIKGVSIQGLIKHCVK
ncbi:MULTISPECIES: hypothetical protein [Streptomyces]|uniref:Carrier domain-containing protein n=1 Tax=Streptomyces lasiicapitis TaxID=1923961 RepID=A0ABQ2MCD6_9ACTN|nr:MULTISPECIES: hypothetical protein [Streptomyces]QIB41994.1 hypothetical protein G3H79_01760 [Streptomyces aureoverticillatus]GGO49478.1 hypothetical protein GCM10012286_47570 [Streptomyces lasiicapitis]